MVFTKTAQKFGQWSDPKAGTIYGVGFLNEDDLSKVGKILELNILFFCTYINTTHFTSATLL